VQSGGNDLRSLIEPALARWDFKPMRGEWLKRLQDPATPSRSMILAIQGLGAVGESDAAGPLLAMVLDANQAKPIRLEAARSLGMLRTSGLEKDAQQLASDSSSRGMVSRVAAAQLLQKHQSSEAVSLLQRLALDPEPSVAVRAVGRLLALDSKLLLPLLDANLANSEAAIRSCAVEVLFQHPSEKHLRLLAGRMDDRHPEVRVKARKALGELGKKKEFHTQVIADASALLMTDQWRGLEQATILLVQFDHKPAASRLVELLEFDRPEVFVTAAWGLRRLAVKETLGDVVVYVNAEIGRLQNLRKLPGRQSFPYEYMDHQLSQLNQFLGQQKYQQADAVLRLFVPQPAMRPVGPESRAAAIWALGLIHDGKTDDNLAGQLEERLNAMSTIPPENPRVRRMAAITLGRLKAKDTLKSLRQHYAAKQPMEDPVNNACGWAIEQITGEPMPPPATIQRVRRDWFLTPNK
jgi:HEAT repeat protein